MSESKKNYHNLYLDDDWDEYITPISFEDGMDWHECELYYASIAFGTKEHRSTFHMHRATHIRKPSKEELQQQARGLLQSCLRKPKKPKICLTRQTMMRSVSFNTLPQIGGSYSQSLSDALNDLPSKGPRVNFDDYISIATIPLIEDYPEDVRSSLWMSPSEIDACMQGALREHAFRRRLVRGGKSGRGNGRTKVQISTKFNVFDPVLNDENQSARSEMLTTSSSKCLANLCESNDTTSFCVRDHGRSFQRA